MKQVDWYFDFISPFAYLASESLHRLPRAVEIVPHPILFAGLLKHWETKGPAEIPEMRRFTFRHIRWLADKHSIPLTFPPMHPFNPLKLLRVCVARDNDSATIQRLFRYVWAEGKSSDSPDDWQALAHDMGIDDIDALTADPAVKAALVNNTEAAITRGIFGVPSFVVDGEIFWGFDAIEFLNDYFDQPSLLASDGMRAVDTMKPGVTRR